MPAFDQGAAQRQRFVEGFVVSSLVFCTGPLTILGSLNDGLGNGADQLFLKSALDGFAAIAFAASFGLGVAASAVTSWQVRVTLLRPRGSGQAVSLERVGAVASTDASTPRPTSTPGPAAGTVLDVPAYSQMVHSGHYPQWGGGGEAWCSPTSTAMVLAYYGIAPAPSGIAPGHADAVVDHTARMVYDHGYDGTGNWAFNTAYAATLVAGDSYVTRLRDLREAEDHIAAGVPLVISIAFGRQQLTGAPISSSNGHLLVVVGFEADGDVVVNDPAGATNADVRRVYDRAQLERLWIAASGGTAYVIRNG